MRFDRRLFFFLEASRGGVERISGADVAEDSPRRADKPLLDTPFFVDDAETEVCRVLDSSGLERACDLRPFGAFDIVGTLRISCFKAGSCSDVSKDETWWTKRLPKMGVACLEACTGLPPRVFPEKSLGPSLSATRFSKSK